MVVERTIEHEVQISDQVVCVTIATGEYHHSDFPHPLLIVDHDHNGNIIAVETVKPYVPSLMAAYAEWVSAGELNPTTFVELVVGKVKELKSNPNPKEKPNANEDQVSH